MPSYRENFPSKWLSAIDLHGRAHPVRIHRVTQEVVKDRNGDETIKPCIEFEGANKKLIMNLTNCRSVAEIAGSDDTDEWPGAIVELYTARVMAFGEEVDAVRIRPTTAVPGQSPVPPTPEEPPADDNIPF